MGIGGERNVEVADADPGPLRVGTATYRVTSSARLNNTSCLKLDSVTNYTQFEANGTRVESDPATGSHYFKPDKRATPLRRTDKSLLVLSEQMGRSVTDSRLTYRLLAFAAIAEAATAR